MCGLLRLLLRQTLMRKSIFVVRGSKVLEADHGLKFLSQVSKKLREKSLIAPRALD